MKEPLERPKQTTQTDLILPHPIELAKLAAILAPNEEPHTSLERAMQFYVEAVYFSRDLSSSTPEELVERFGSARLQDERLTQLLSKGIAATWGDTLELDLAKDDDAARQFLAANGLLIKTGRVVLDNIRCYWNELPKDIFGAETRESAKHLVANFKVKNSKTVYAIPKHLLQKVVTRAKRRRSYSKRKAWKTRQNKSPV